MVYLDYAATAPMSEVALEAYTSAARDVYGNSASLHDVGGAASFYVEQARNIIAGKLGVTKDGIIFTGSGTEGNILAILTLAKSVVAKKHVITFQAEHTSIHAAMNVLQEQGYVVEKLPLQTTGEIDLAQLDRTIRHDTALISIQHVNGEIGAIFPIAKIAQLAKSKGVLLHVDCVQSFCKLPIAPFAHFVDALTISAHKVGGPKGCGAVYINPYLNAPSITPGVTHERGLRGGTLDTPNIVAFAAAVERYTYNMAHCTALRTALIKSLPSTYHVVQCREQLPSICSILSTKYEGQFILLKCNDANVYISTGSACDIRNESGTKAVNAMGYSIADARKFFRVSFSTATPLCHIETLTNVLKLIK